MLALGPEQGVPCQCWLSEIKPTQEWASLEEVLALNPKHLAEELGRDLKVSFGCARPSR